MSKLNERNKAVAIEFWEALDAKSVKNSISVKLASDMRWDGFAPFTKTSSSEEFLTKFVEGFYSIFDVDRRETHILIGGISNGRADGKDDGNHWVGGTGYLHVRQKHKFGPISAQENQLRLRWGEFLQFDELGKIIRVQTIFDIIDWLEQINLSPLPKPLGNLHVYPAPTACEGFVSDQEGKKQSKNLLKYARDFIFGGLNGFDKVDLKSMGMADFFHPNLKWYGPGGIGACLSFKEFEDLHQRPWLHAFPDRRVGDLDNLIAEGSFVGASSMPGVSLTHQGPYLGQKPSNNKCTVNGIDFWREDDGKFVENWVFVDMVHLFFQMGVDLLAMVKHDVGDIT